MAQQVNGSSVILRNGDVNSVAQARSPLPVNTARLSAASEDKFLLVPRECAFQAFSKFMLDAYIEFQMARKVQAEAQQLVATSSSSSWHENTEDLDALLDSDDESDSESVTSNMYNNNVYNGAGAASLDQGGYTSSEGETDGHTKEKLESHARSSNSWDSLSVKRSKGKSNDLSKKSWRIKDRINVLKRIIPGCKTKDSAFVLEEAVGYIQKLQAAMAGKN